MTNPTLLKPNRISLEVAILGGGFAGVYCGKELCRNRKKLKDCEKSGIVSEQNYMVFQPMLAEVAGASLSPQHVINPIRRLCRNLRVIKGAVKNIDLEKKEVLIDTGSFSSGVCIEFKQLVVSLGAEIDLSRVPGIPEHAMLMQNVGDAMVLRATIISRIEEANVESRPDVRQRLLTFVIVGGGYSGVETAGEVLDMLHETCKYYGGVPREEIRVVLVHSRGQILPTLSSSLGEYAARKLEERGLELCLNERVKAVTATRVYLTSGATIESATIVSTVGNAPNSVIREMCDTYGVPHDRYRIITDQSMKVPDFDFLWSAGDCAAVPYSGEEGGYCPQTAQFAMRQGKTMAQNLVRHIEGEPLKPFLFKGMGELASIGHQTAVANVMGLKFSGIIAWFMWRSIYLSKLPGLDRKTRVIIDWTLDLFFPRDINLLNPRYTKVYQEVHLEAGDRLFSTGEPAFSLYVVKEGEIELRDGDDAVRTIGPGDFFGERALVHGSGYVYDAVSPVETQLVSVSGEVIVPFLKASRRLRRVLAKTTAQKTAEGEMQSIRSKLDEAILTQPIANVMRTDLATLKTGQSTGDAMAMFKKRRFSTYPLVTDKGVLVGVIGREDFFDFLKRENVDYSSKLDKVDLRHLPVCECDQPVSEALEQMVRAGRYKCLIVDDSNRLTGIITVMDLLGEAADTLCEIPES
ncbi:MAG: FAD-dependent oxidoreductase [Verrucomicrobiales bacterium]|nr:FAD-dependent oxidoreductase [Verrucomicrobiales bacterium]